MSDTSSSPGMTLDERFATLDAVIARKNEQIATLQVKLAQVHAWMTSDDGLDRLIAIMKDTAAWRTER